MHYLRTAAAMAVILALILFSACNVDSGPEYPEHEPFIPEYGLEDFKDYPGNNHPAWDISIDYRENIEDLFNQYFNAMIALDPQLVSTRRFPDDVVPHQPDKLTPVSFGVRAWQIELAKDTLEVLTRYSDADLSKEQQVDKAILKWALEQMIAGEKFIYHDVLNLENLVSLFVFMQMHHEIGTVEDAENYLARLTELPEVLRELETNLRIQAEIGYVPPLAVLDTAYNSTNMYATFLLNDFTLRVDMLEGKEDLVGRCQQIIASQVRPAYRDLGREIDKLRSVAVDNVSQLPGGRDYYAWLLKDYTTMDITPVEVHKICLAEVERLQEEIEEVLDSQGHDSTDYIQSIKQLSRNTIAEGAVIRRYGELIEMAEEYMPQLFGHLPETPVEIHPNTIRTGYDIPTRDGSLPGVFLTNPAGSHPEIGAKWFVWHETIPGHHMQMAIEYEADVHYFRDLFFLTGYLEGWGTYGEMLLFEYGLVDDPLGYLGSLNRYLMLAARVVLDTGINYIGWSEEEGAEWYSQVTGLDPAPWINDVVTRPGRSAAYYVGMYKIRQLRELAEEELGAAFDVREFHDLILQYGSMPIDVLEELVIEYIEEKK